MSDDRPFKQGDRVKVRGMGPVMLVMYCEGMLGEGFTECLWWQESNQDWCTRVLPTSMLEPASRTT